MKATTRLLLQVAVFGAACLLLLSVTASAVAARSTLPCAVDRR